MHYLNHYPTSYVSHLNSYLHQISPFEQISQSQEIVDQKLEKYNQVPYEYTERILAKTWVRYVTQEGKYRSGGKVIKNKFPDYLVLLNPWKQFTWCVDLKKNSIYILDTITELEKKSKMKKLWDLYQANRLQLIEDEQEDEAVPIMLGGGNSNQQQLEQPEIVDLKNKLYQLYQDGLLTLVDEAEIETIVN